MSIVDESSSALRKMIDTLTFFKSQLAKDNHPLVDLLNRQINLLSTHNEITNSNKIEISVIFLKAIYHFTSLNLNFNDYYFKLMSSLSLVVNTKIVNQSSYLLMLCIINNLTNFYNSFTLNIKNMFIHNTLELLATLIQDEFIQLSSKIVHLNFTVIVKILRNIIIDDKISNDSTMRYSAFLERYSLLMFKFLEDLLKPLLIKKKVTATSKETLDDTPTQKKRTQHSFYTITESQSENDQSQYANLATNANYVSANIIDNSSESLQLDLKEYKNVDIYNNCIYVFGYFLNVIVSSSSSICYLKIAIEIMTNLINKTNSLFSYLDEYKNAICCDLANKLSILLQNANQKIDIELKEKIAYLIYAINFHFHRGYWLLPFLLCEHKNNFYSNEKFICYDILERITSDASLLDDIYCVKYEKNLHLRNKYEMDTDCMENIVVINVFLSILSEKNLNLISKMKNSDEVLNIKKKSKQDYIDIITKINLNFQSYLNTILNNNHIYLNSPFPSEIENTNEHTKLKEKILFFSSSIANIQQFIISESIIAKSSLDDLFDQTILYCTIFSLFNYSYITNKILINWIEVVKEEISNDDFLYIAKSFLLYIAEPGYNNSIENWISNFSFLQSIYVYLSKHHSEYIIIPQPENDIKVYIKHIEHFIRMYSFNYYDTLLRNDIAEYTDESEFNLSSCNNTKSFVKTNGTIINSSFVGSPDTNNTTLRISLMKFKPIITNNLRKQSESINSHTLTLNVLNSLNHNSSLNKTPQPTSFIEKESTNHFLVLSNSLDSFFIENSVNYDTNYLLVIINALVKNSLNSLLSNKIEEMKCNLIKIVEITSVNIFRVNLFWNKISIIIHETFCSTQDFTLKIFCFDTAIMIYMFTLFSFNEDEQENEENSYWTNDKYQVIIFDNMHKLIEKLVDINNDKLTELAIKDIYSLLYHVGNKVNKSGWKSFFDSFIFLITNLKEVFNSFDIVSLIIDEYMDTYGIYNISYLLQILNIFLKGSEKNKEKVLDYIDKLSLYYNNNYTSINCCEFYDKTKSLLFTSILDEDYSIRQKTIKIFEKIFIEKNQFVSCNSKKCLNNKEFYSILLSIYTLYQTEAKKRIERHDYNNTDEDAIAISDVKLCQIEPNIYKKTPSGQFSPIIPSQSEKELQQTLISLLSLLSHIKDINLDLFIPFIDTVLTLSSSEIISKVVLCVNNILSYYHFEERIGIIMKKVFNVISSDFFLFNFWYYKDVDIVYNSIEYIKHLNNSVDSKDNSESLIQLMKYIQEIDMEELAKEEIAIFEFINTLNDNKEIIKFYLKICTIKDKNIHSFSILEFASKKFIQILKSNEIVSLVDSAKDIDAIVDNFNNSRKFFDYSIERYKKYEINYMNNFFELVSLLLMNLNVNKIYLYEKVNDIIMSLYTNEKNSSVNEILVNFVSNSFIKITNDNFSNYKNKLLHIIKNTFFNYKEEKQLNDTLLLLLVSNLLNKENICECSKEILLTYLQTELIDENRNEISIRKSKVSHIVSILEKIEIYVQFPEITNDKPFLNKLKEAINKLTISTESSISNKSSLLLSSI